MELKEYTPEFRDVCVFKGLVTKTQETGKEVMTRILKLGNQGVGWG